MDQQPECDGGDVPLVAALIAYLIRNRYAKPDSFLGFSPADVSRLEEILTRPLPPVYKEFLLLMGRKSFVSKSIMYMCFDSIEDIVSLKREMLTLVFDDEQMAEPLADKFVFAHVDGYQYVYFHLTTDGKNPHVGQYVEGQGFEDLHETFLEFLLLCLNETITPCLGPFATPRIRLADLHS